MILTAIIGNTNTEFAWFRGQRCTRTVRVTTMSLRSGRMPVPGRVTGVALASVVPGLTQRFVARLSSATGLRPFVVGPRTRTGLKFRYRRDDLGADRVCVAVGAWRRFPNRDMVVFDFGTATTVNVILREGVFAGGAILPGIQMSLDALATATAALPRLVPGKARSPIQHDTRSAMRAGVACFLAGGIDGIITRIEQQTGRSFRIVSTGGGAGAAHASVRRVRAIYPHLAREGLAELFHLNCPGQSSH